MLLGGLLASIGCVRDPVEVACPDVGAGQLVISELRGKQSGEDTYGQWIEIYNTTSAPVELFGARITMQKLDGSGAAQIFVRDQSLQVPAKGYAVLGKFASDALPAHVDYGYQLDFDGNLHDSGAIDLFACEALIDRVIYHNLTGTGTWALDGNGDPNATTNDDEAQWCVDDREMPDPMNLGLPGTPGERNYVCGS